MQQFQYKYGDRPLSGYTIQRGVGRGGFGEVYYAVSDSGKQVALKTIQAYEQIELRGVNQCMNLKSPHLVTVFDVKYNDSGRPFVIMEYVSGPSLADLIKESPGGLGTQKAAFFLREIAKGLSYLHECGIVHRDLKPSNIFYEDGRVRIGDYGLSKAMNTSMHSGQTITVGTVHYMAPEIGAGCYNKSIDIYAMGILLYEMLTGQVPYFGNSPAEVLMKHMTGEPDLKGVDETFGRVIRKALVKNPEERYQSVQEMVEDVFGSEHIRNSVSQFSPRDLSIVADRIALKTKPQARHEPGTAGTRPQPIPSTDPSPASKPASTGTGRRGGPEMAVSLQQAQANDPVTRQQRYVLALIAAAVVAMGCGILSGRRHMIFPGSFITVMMIFVVAKVILLSQWKWKWPTNLEDESGWLQRLITATIAAILPGAIMTFFNFMGVQYNRATLAGTWFSFALAIAVIDWWKVSDPNRHRRILLSHALWAGFVGFVTAAIFNGTEAITAGVLAGTSLVVQILSPFCMTTNAREAFNNTRQKNTWAPGKNADPQADTAAAQQILSRGYAVPGVVRLGWLIAFIALISIGVGLCIGGANHRHGSDDTAIMLGFGIGCLWLGLSGFLRVFYRRFDNWFSYLIRPVACSVCLGTAVFGILAVDVRNFPEAVAIAIAIAGGLGFLTMLFIPASVFGIRKPQKSQRQPVPAPVPGRQNISPSGVSPYKRLWALVLSAGMFLGVFGLHRFYVGKIGTGILWFLTFGLFGIGQVIDIVMIVMGQFRDKFGRALLVWEDQNELEELSWYRNRKGAQQMHQQAADTDQSPPRDGADPGHEQTAEPAAGTARHIGRPMDSSAIIADMMAPVGSLVNGILALIAFLLTLAAFAVGTLTALHFGYVISAGFPEPEAAQELTKFFGNADWPRTLEDIAFMVMSGLLLIALGLLITARRSKGGGHIVRAVLGCLGFWCTIGIMNGKIGTPYAPFIADALKGQPPGPAIQAIVNSFNDEWGILAIGLFVGSMVLLAWPAKKAPPTSR